MGKKKDWDPDLRGVEYTPFLTVRTPSHGKVSRLAGLRTGRVHHVLSGIELDYLYLLEWRLDVVDIREQYALPLEETERIALELEIPHPTENDGGLSRRTTDFLVTCAGPDAKIEFARSCKPSEKLESDVTLKVAEIERQYWKRNGVDWKFVTERDIPRVLVCNIKWVHPFTMAIPTSVSPDHATWLTNQLHLRLREAPGQPLAHVCSAADEQTGYEAGTHLSLVRHALANRRWRVDMNSPIAGTLPLPFLDLPTAGDPTNE